MDNQFIDLSHNFYIWNRNMELYSIAKYENILERIRRLAASPPHNKQSTDQLSANLPPSNKHTLNTSYLKAAINSKSNVQIEDNSNTYKQTPFQKQKMVDQSNTYAKGQTSTTQSKGQALALSSEQQQKSKQNIKTQASKKLERRCIEKELPKVKSEGNLKIEQILQSYNNYRLNKQQYLNNSRPKDHNRHSEQQTCSMLSKEEDADTTLAESLQSDNRTECVFNPIDSIWNETPVETQTGCQRSVWEFRKKPISGLLIQKSQNMQREQEDASLNLSKCRFISKESQKERQTNKSKPSGSNELNSPRRLRVPGRICRNKLVPQHMSTLE